MKHVDIYTDGSCRRNPGPGGWGAILVYNGHELALSGGEASTTNNRMELLSVISALERLKEGGMVELDEERKAAMVSNLLVVLCGNHDAQPVVNSGSLY